MDATEIYTGLYLGNSTYNEIDLYNLNIDTVINMTPEFEIKCKVKQLEFYRYPVSCFISDEESKINLLNAIDHVYKLIKEDHKVVYLHCFEGVNRSATVAIGLISKLKNISIKDAYLEILQKRKIIPQTKYLDIINEI